MTGCVSRLGVAAVLLCAGLPFGAGYAADSPARPDNRWKEQTLRNRLLFFGGADVATDSFFTWSGITGALDGSPHEDGWHLRVFGGAGRYRYRTGAVPGGTNKADVLSGEFMLGYRFTHAETVATLFAGAHVESQELHAPDPGHRAQGIRVGIKGVIEFYRRFNPSFFATASASASSVHRAYHLRAAFAHQHAPGLAWGVETALQGDVRYNEPRAGLFMESTYGRTTLSLAGGVLSNSDKGGGGYATLSVQAAY